VRRASDYIGTAFPTLHWVDCQRDNNNHNNNYNDNSQLQQHLQALKYRPSTKVSFTFVTESLDVQPSRLSPL
jgi:hypothetical protein